MHDPSRSRQDHLREAYTNREAAAEYDLRHRRTPVRRFVSRREARIVEALLRSGGAPAESAGTEPKSGGGAIYLDAPCGAGRIASQLASTGRQFVALDGSADMLRQGIGRGSLPAGRVVAGSLFALPFAAGSFAGAVCIRFLHHLDGPAPRRAVLGELRSAVDGPLVASVWTGPSLQWWRRSLRRSRGRRPSARYRVDLEALREDAAFAGWKLTRVRYLFRFVSETAYVLLK
jgi:SAM-dependent methyltransferase